MGERMKEAFAGKYGPVIATLCVNTLVIGLLLPWVKDVNTTLKDHGERLASFGDSDKKASQAHETLRLEVERDLTVKLETRIKEMNERLDRYDIERRRDIESLRDKMELLRIGISDARMGTEMVSRQLVELMTKLGKE